MDRSYLSDPGVIAASREFICVRLVTYEDVGEMEFMNSIYDFRTPTKNSLFAILDPAAKEHLVQAGRSMRYTFDDATQMASRMNEISKALRARSRALPSKLGLPYLKDVRVALNVASCDAQCLVILHATKAGERRKLESLLLPLAWHEDLVGEFLYASTDDVGDLDNISGSGAAAGLLVVAPGAYGLKAVQVAFVPLGTESKEARATLLAAAEANRMGSKDSKRHIGRGLREGIRWEPLVDDPGPSARRRGARGPRSADGDASGGGD